eukprot:EC713771.1.p1 GENE.EC713771.1~~EC713771.1.p1  ORF type:complete len:73 (-),score=1.11 EC713771.1:321-539(-)
MAMIMRTETPHRTNAKMSMCDSICASTTSAHAGAEAGQVYTGEAMSVRLANPQHDISSWIDITTVTPTAASS